MSMECFKCNQNFNNGKCLRCDGCKRPICYQCSELSSTEIRCIELKNRVLKFFCKECEDNLLQVPVLRSLIADLQTEVEKLKGGANCDSADSEVIISEVAERQKRASNIIIFNAPESNDVDPVIRKQHDKQIVETFLRQVYDSIPAAAPTMDIKPFRLGRRVNENIRPLKVTLHSRDDALFLLKNKARIAGRTTMKMVADLTPMQREHMTNLRKQLETRTLNGEKGITIKYVRGIPKIVERSN